MAAKKIVVIVLFLILVISGVFLTILYSQPVDMQEVLASGVLVIPGSGYSSIVFDYSQSAKYSYTINVSNGLLLAILNERNVTDLWLTGQFQPSHYVYNASSGTFVQDVQANEPTAILKEYLIFSNSDTFDKEVRYQIQRTSTGYNYIGLLSGISSVIIGVVFIIITKYKVQLKDLNKALENQT